MNPTGLSRWLITCAMISAASLLPAADNDEISTTPLVDTVATSRASTTTLAPAEPDSSKVASNPYFNTSLLSGTVVLATYTGGEFTNQELSATIAMRQTQDTMTYSPEQVLRLQPDRLKPVVRDLVFEELLYQEARKEGVTEETTSIKKAIDDFKADALNKLYFEREIQPRLANLSEEAGKEYYEANKDRLFIVPERLSVREIFLSKYKLYKVKEGDTISSIATEQSGDVQAADEILRTDPYRYPRLSERAAKGEVPFAQPKPGEELLVPLKKDEQTSKAQLAKKIRDEITSDTFVRMAEQYSEIPETATKTQAFSPNLSAIAPKLAAALEGKKSGDVTDLVETTNGWHILQVVARESSRTMTYDEAKQRQLIQVDDQQKRSGEQRTLEQLSNELEKKHNLKINTDVLKRETDQGADPLTANTVIASAPGFTYTLEEFRQNLQPSMKSWTSMTYDERLKFVKAAPAVARYLVQSEAKAAGLDQTPEFRSQLESKLKQEISMEYLRRKLQQPQPTDQQLREYYTSHIDKYTSPARVALREITKRVSLSLPDDERHKAIEDAKEELRKIKSQITTLADFEQAARRESEALSTRSHGGYVGTVPVNFRRDMFQNQIEQLKPAEVSEPFLYGGEVMIIRVDEFYPAAPRPFEEVLSQVRTDYLREMPIKRFEEFRDALLKKYDYQPKI